MKFALSIILVLMTGSLYSQPIKKKVFFWDVKIPAIKRFHLDSTYKLFIRKICRRRGRSDARPFGESVFRDECINISPGTLIEIQYLYYSQAHRNALFIMLIPNYPRHQNGLPTFDRPEIKDAPTVNLWNANCFLFGKMNSTSDTITFKKWAVGEDKWVVNTDPLGGFIEIKQVKEYEAKTYESVVKNLAVSVIYRESLDNFPLVIDGSMFCPPKKKKLLTQEIFFEQGKKDRYKIHFPYAESEANAELGIAFKGRKYSRSRLPYDITPFFK